MNAPTFEEFDAAIKARANRVDLFQTGILAPDESTKTKEEFYPHERGFTKEFLRGTFVGYPCTNIFLQDTNASFDIPGIGRGDMGKGIYEDAMRISFHAETPFSRDAGNLCDAVVSFLEENDFCHNARYGTTIGIDYSIHNAMEGCSIQETGSKIHKDIAMMLEEKYGIREVKRDGDSIVMKRKCVTVALYDTNEHSLFNSISFAAERGADQELFHKMQQSIADFLKEEYISFIGEPHQGRLATGFHIDVFYKADERVELMQINSTMFYYLMANIQKLGFLGIKTPEELKRKVFAEGIAQLKNGMLNPEFFRSPFFETVGRPTHEVLGEYIKSFFTDLESPGALALIKFMHSNPCAESELSFVLHGREILEYETLLQDINLRRGPHGEEGIKESIVSEGIVSLFDLLCSIEHQTKQDIPAQKLN